MRSRSVGVWGLVVAGLMGHFAACARAQAPALPAPTVPADLATILGEAEGVGVGGVQPPELLTPINGPGVPRPSLLANGPRVEMSPLETVTDSLLGDVYAPGRWRPLSFGTFFSEGWLEPWAGGPAGESGLTPRHGWLGAFEGVFYRLWVAGMTYQQGLNAPYGGNSYTSSYTIFLPFSRRFELALHVPFVTANGTTDIGRGYRSDFGDLIIGTRFLLSETARTTQTFNLDIRVPTGQVETGNNLMALTPRYEFWSNPFGAWVVRGGAGINAPLNKNDLRPYPVLQPNGNIGFGESTAQTGFTGDFAVGRYFRPHDVPFGDLVLYAASNVIVPFEDRGIPTYFGVGPGTRFHIANDYYFLNYWEFPLVGPRAFDYQMQVAILKVF